MPRTEEQGFADDSHESREAQQQTNTTPASAQDQTAASEPLSTPVRRRRGGRRVVRGAGAAGADLALKVEEHPKPLFEEPAISPVSAQQPALPSDDTETAETDEPRHTPQRGRRRVSRGADAQSSVRSRRRTRSVAEDEPSAQPTSDSAGLGGHGAADAETPEERVQDALDLLSHEHGDAGSSTTRVRHRSKPMTSLLFQEPVLPARQSSDPDAEDGQSEDDADRHDDREEEREPRRARRTRSRRGRGRNDDDMGREDGHLDQGADSREGRGEYADDANREDDEPRRGRRSRRLNAQERRAAAEVEQIEEDLEYDDIAYTPIAEVMSGNRNADGSRNDDHADTDEDAQEGTRTRRRRRRAAREESEDDNEQILEVRRRHRDEDEDTTVTRRRRRRRSGKGIEESEEPVRRSRKQQYIDEITDVEGSTRLEAKKQRRRDNRRERSRQNQIMEQDFLARREHVDRLMVVRERGHHTQISVIEDNVLVEHYVSDIQEVATVGNIYLGRVQNVLPSMEAAFVNIGQPRNGVLYAGEVNWDATRLEGQPRRIELAFKSGDPVLVQVTKDPIGHKGARLTSQVTLAGRFLVLVPSGGMTGVSRKLPDRERARLKSIVSKIAPKDMGVIIRTAAEGASEEAIEKDLEALRRQWDKICEKRDLYLHGKRPKLLQGEPDVAIRVVRDIFNDDFSQMIVEGDRVYERIEEYLDTMAPDLRDKLVKWDPEEHGGKDVFDKWQIDSQLRKGMERQVYLPSGGSIVIDRTEAMTTIDVNTGRFIGKGKSLEETVTRCNLEASEEIARQLRLRDIGGMIMIDYVDMVMPANRDLVLRRLVECLARDRTKHQVAEVTSLGLVQMTRKRIGQGLVEAFSEECPTCKGRGFIIHDEPTVSAEYDDPYAMKGGDPFVKTNKHGHGTPEVQAPKGSSPAVKAKLAQIAAAAVAANNAENAENAEHAEHGDAAHSSGSSDDASDADFAQEVA
ncbi:Rne/Rng family ribonuclease [Bifidobacterium apri]|uniref:Rne/Rng family ribonuclease n=1 Tax=Bifidobacterium apri TaxID=1769423 RepID=UPI0039936851